MNVLHLKWAVQFRTSSFVPRTSFQPFFATKPTGQGTGLSLSDDIVKAHRGELRVETKEGGGE